MLRRKNMSKNLYLKKQIEECLIKKYGKDNVFIVSTEGYDLTTNPKGRNSKKERSEWADNVVSKLYNGKKRNKIIKMNARVRSTGEYNFSYIKFAQNSKEEIYGIVNGKSSFHCMYPSDVWFYEFEDESKKTNLKTCMENNDLHWYTKEILILKNKDKLNSKEAYDNEKVMHKLFDLYN